MPGLGQPNAGIPGQTAGLGLGQAGAAGPLNGALGGAARLGGGAAAAGGAFGGMQGQPASYNPSGEILAMINKGQNLGLGLPQAQPQGLGGMGGGLPQGLGQQPGMPGTQVGGGPAGLGGMPGLGGVGADGQVGGAGGVVGMGGVAASPSFDMSDFPSLGQRAGAQPGGASAMQQFRGGPGGGMGVVQPGPPQSEFAIQNEDFPALPGAAPASSSLGGGGMGADGRGGGGLGGFRNSAVESGVEALLGPPSGKDGDGGVGLGGLGGGHVVSGVSGGGTGPLSTDRYGLMGLLNVIRMTDQDLNTLALGTDLTTLGLNLNSSECLYATFASPWADAPAQRDPEFSLPQCYYMQPPALKTGHFSKFRLETLFYIFYNMPRDTLQAYAATELYNRDWRYHKDLKLWFTKASRTGAGQEQQKGHYIYFDINEWRKKMFHGAAGGSAGGGANGADVEGESAAGIEDL